MTRRSLALALPLALFAALAVPAAARANSAIDLDGASGAGSAVLPPYLQCVPYARQVSGIQIYGDAHTWWGQAEGRYAKGNLPRIGAVMAFKPHGNMRLGHVAAVSRIVDPRTVLLKHSNWSPINGRRGQIEDNVRAIDVSPANDWSEVRVWFGPNAALGNTHWPVHGFIYSAKSGLPGASSRRPAIVRATAESISAASRAADPIGAIIAARLQ